MKNFARTFFYLFHITFMRLVGNKIQIQIKLIINHVARHLARRLQIEREAPLSAGVRLSILVAASEAHDFGD
jgi:hypothetical protein